MGRPASSCETDAVRAGWWPSLEQLRRPAEYVSALHHTTDRAVLDRAGFNFPLGDRTQHNARFAGLETDHRLGSTTHEAGIESDLGSPPAALGNTDHGHGLATERRRADRIGSGALIRSLIHGPRPGMRGVDLSREHAAGGADINDELVPSLDFMKLGPAAVRLLVTLLPSVRPANDNGFT